MQRGCKGDIAAFFCSRMFQSPRRKQKKQDELWNKYVWGKQSLADLSQEDKPLHVWVRKLRTAYLPPLLVPHPVAIGTDTTFWGQSYGVCVLRGPEKENIWWQEVELRTHGPLLLWSEDFRGGGMDIPGSSSKRQAGLIKRSKKTYLRCTRLKTVTKYLTPAARNISGTRIDTIMLQLPRSNEVEFTKRLVGWKKIGTNSSPKHASREQKLVFTHKSQRCIYEFRNEICPSCLHI